jgi:hypothetical protein
VKKADLDKLSAALDLVGYEIEKLSPSICEMVNDGKLDRSIQSGSFDLTIVNTKG